MTDFNFIPNECLLQDVVSNLGAAPDGISVSLFYSLIFHIFKDTLVYCMRPAQYMVRPPELVAYTQKLGTSDSVSCLGLVTSFFLVHHMQFLYQVIART